MARGWRTEETHGELRSGDALLLARLDDAVPPLRDTDADRVAEADLVRAHVLQRPGHLAHLARVDPPVKGAPEDDAHVPAHLEPLVPRGGKDGLEARERLGDGAVEVGAREALGRRDEDGNLAREGRVGRVLPGEVEEGGEAAGVGNQDGEGEGGAVR